APPPSDGESLLPLLEGRDRDYRRSSAIAEASDGHGVELALRNRSWKLIVRPGIGADQLFDHDEDPGERHDLAAVQGERGRELALELDAALGRDREDPFRPAKQVLSPQLREQLQALGYVH